MAATKTVKELIREYRDYLTFEQGASKNTLMGYQSWLRRFNRFLEERRGGEVRIDDIAEEDIRAYLYHLANQGLRPRTLRGSMYPVRGMLGLAKERHYLPENPALPVKLPKKDAAQRVTVSDEELLQLLSGCERFADPLRRSMCRAVLAVLVYGGLRRQEMLDLEVADVDLAEGKILVRSGKGGKSRAVYVCRDCLDMLKEWLSAQPQTKTPYLFIADCRRRLGEAGLAKLLKEVRAMADLGESENLTPHAMRHAAATRLLRNGADLKSIQQFLGHSSLQTTAIYLHTDEYELQRISGLTAFKGNHQAQPPSHPQRNFPARKEPFRERLPLRRRSPGR